MSQDQRNWDLVLPKVTCAIRTAKHEVIGHTQYFVNFGREMFITGERFSKLPDRDIDSNETRHDAE